MLMRHSVKDTLTFKINNFIDLKVVEVNRIELMTSCVQGRRSPS